MRERTSHRRGFALVLAIAAARLAISPACAAPTRLTKSAGSTSAGGTAAVKVSADSAAAKGVLDRALAALRGAKTVSGKALISVDVTPAPGGHRSGPPPRRQTMTASLAFARPDRLALETSNVSLFTDGKTLWTVMKPLRQYREAAAPANTGTTSANLAWFSAIASKTPSTTAGAEIHRAVEQALDEFLAAASVTAERKGTAGGKRLAGSARLPWPGLSKPAELEVWFADSDGFAREIAIGVVPTTPTRTPRMAAEPAGPQVRFGIDLSGLQLDLPLPATQFVFAPPPGYKKVDEFKKELPPRQAAQQELVGKPAPELTGASLDGKPLTLAALRGSVVLIDFWATWCPPCVRSLPGVQKLAAKFDGRPVAVLGVNLDSGVSDAKIRAFLAKHGILFRQILDGASGNGASYRISGIPCSVLVDKKGTVRFVGTGYSADAEDRMSERIEKLLRGDSID